MHCGDFPATLNPTGYGSQTKIVLCVRSSAMCEVKGQSYLFGMRNSVLVSLFPEHG